VSRPRRPFTLVVAAVFLALPAVVVAESDGVKEIHGIARSAATLRLAEVDPPADKPGGGGGSHGGGHGGGGGGATGWTEVDASATNSNATYSGLPVNEPFVAASGSYLIAGANDYRSGNGQGQAAAYVSSDGGQHWSGAFLQKSTTWDDASNHGSGDPWLAFGGSLRAYFSAIYFNFDQNCDGGLYLVAAASPSGLTSTAPVQIAANTSTQFQDKPAVAVLPASSSDTVAVTWTGFQENGCTDTAYYSSPILARISTDGGGSFGSVITVPAPTTYSQGSFPVFDPATGDLYVAYENWASASALNGRIVVARIPAGSTSGTAAVVSDIIDLPATLPGTKFRVNSFPALAIANGRLAVTWASETGNGYSQITLATHPLGDPSTGGWSTTRVDGDVSGTALTVGASDRFFPAIASNGSDLGLVWLDRRDDGSNKQYRAWGAFFTVGPSGGLSGGTNAPIATVLSNTSQDPFFRGQFIGDYIGAAYDGSGGFHPVWTDMRSKAPLPYHGNTQEIWSAYK
jgi:hypothetical protein